MLPPTLRLAFVLGRPFSPSWAGRPRQRGRGRRRQSTTFAAFTGRARALFGGGIQRETETHFLGLSSNALCDAIKWEVNAIAERRKEIEAFLNLPTLSASAAPCPPPSTLAVTSRSRRTIRCCVARWLLRCGGEVVVVVFAVFLADETGATVVVAGKDLGMPPSTLGGGAGA